MTITEALRAKPLPTYNFKNYANGQIYAVHAKNKKEAQKLIFERQSWRIPTKELQRVK